MNPLYATEHDRPRSSIHAPSARSTSVVSEKHRSHMVGLGRGFGNGGGESGGNEDMRTPGGGSLYNLTSRRRHCLNVGFDPVEAPAPRQLTNQRRSAEPDRKPNPYRHRDAAPDRARPCYMRAAGRCPATGTGVARHLLLPVVAPMTDRAHGRVCLPVGTDRAPVTGQRHGLSLAPATHGRRLSGLATDSTRGLVMNPVGASPSVAPTQLPRHSAGTSTA